MGGSSHFCENPGQTGLAQLVSLNPQLSTRDHLPYHPRVRLHALQTDNITGTSTRTPTTVAKAAGESAPKSVIATATASSKKLLAPIRAQGDATLCSTLNHRMSRYVSPELKYTCTIIGTAISSTATHRLVRFLDSNAQIKTS